MNIEAIGALDSVITPPSLNPSTATTSAAGSPAPGAPAAGFANWFEQLAEVNQQMTIADQGLQKLAAGEAVNLHQVMIQLEQAKLSVQMFVQVRNRLLEAYQEVMRMQM